MTLNYNKKKINILPNLRVIKYLFIFLFFSLSFVFAYNELKNKNKLYDFIHHVSEKFNYQLKNYEINSLHRVEKNDVVKILNKYLDQSIFLIPLSDISNSIYNLNWVKSVYLSTNLKNKIEVEISEYKPVGLFYYNKQFFYFSEEGKIIDTYLNNNSENFIIFQGVRVLRKANDFLITLEKYKNSFSNIKEAYYVNERR